MAFRAQHLNNQFIRNWDNCPTEIMIMFFSHLDLESLENCIFVNKFWNEAITYYLEHFNIWRQIVEDRIFNEGVLYKEKCNLQWREILFNFYLWRKVWNARVSLHRNFYLNHVETLRVYKNNLIIVLDDTVKYLNLLNAKCNKTLDLKCSSYEESDFLIIIVTEHERAIYIQNKKCDKDIQFCEKFNLNNNMCYKLYSNWCYFIDNSNTLWSSGTEQYNCVKMKALAKFYGPRESIIALHVFEDYKYIVTKEGNVYCVAGLQFKMIYNIFSRSHYFNSIDNSANSNYRQPVPFLFNKGCVAYRVPASEIFYIYDSLGNGEAILEVPNLSALLEHGEILILGYEDGKIEIHSIHKILSYLNKPDKQFNIREFVYYEDGNYRIHTLDVYEEVDKHYLVVATDNDVHQFLIQITD